MSQEKDVLQFLEDNHIVVTKEVECPMPNRKHMSQDDKPLDKEDTKRFRSLVGSLGFYTVSLHVRWDISRSVARVQQMQSAPTPVGGT